MPSLWDAIKSATKTSMTLGGAGIKRSQMEKGASEREADAYVQKIDAERRRPDQGQDIKPASYGK